MTARSRFRRFFKKRKGDLKLILDFVSVRNGLMSGKQTTQRQKVPLPSTNLCRSAFGEGKWDIASLWV